MQRRFLAVVLLASAASLALSCNRTPLEGREIAPYQAGGASAGTLGAGAFSGVGGGAGSSAGFGGGSAGAAGAGIASGGAGQSGAGASGAGMAGRAGGGSGGVSGSSGSAGAAGSGGAATVPFALIGAPMPYSPTESGFRLSVTFQGSGLGLRARTREVGTAAWSELQAPEFAAPDAAVWAFTGLNPATRYEYALLLDEEGEQQALFEGSVTTARPPGSSFTFALLTDSHIPPRQLVPGETDTINYQEDTLAVVAQDIGEYRPDFMMNLGDMLDFHMFGFNVPPPDSSWTRLGYLNYRRLFGDVLGSVPHYAVVGNWDGESGCDSDVEIERSRSQRLRYLPGPTPETYPQGGSPVEDYYAFTWGDALFVVLNVMTYTPTCHLLGAGDGRPTDWTLGAHQLDFLERTLKEATSPWRFLLIHHAVGGAAGTDADSAYGRGGGQAARVGEQSLIHDLMLNHGVQVFFYGHDHVFADMVVDGIRYTLPGSAGAPWKFTTAETGYVEYWPDSGHARVTVNPDLLHVEFLSIGGEVIYQYELTR